MRGYLAALGGCALAFVFNGCGDSGEEFKAGPKKDSGSGGTATTGGSSGADASGGASGGAAASGGSAGDASIDASGGTAGVDAPPDGACTDADGDGVDTCSGDCDDNDPTSYPGNPSEICGDGKDNDCANGPDDKCGGLGTFVSALTGYDTNPGTQDKPVYSIHQGIANAKTIQATTQGVVEVYVAEGAYSEKVVLVEGIGLVGGFSCMTQPCSWARDPKLYVAFIQNQDFEGVLADSTITRKTRLDGFHIQGKLGDPLGAIPGSSAVMLAGGSPTVVNNEIQAGNATAGTWPSGRSVGVAAIGPSNDVKGALIQKNSIKGAQSPVGSAGILLDGSGKPGFTYAEILGNQISGGQGSSASGIAVGNTGSGTLIRNNDIAAGESTAGPAWGISIWANAMIDANRINADPSITSSCVNSGFCGGISSQSSTSVITNNVVFGIASSQSTAVLLGEFETPAGSVTLNSNYLDGAGISSSAATSAAIVLQHGLCCGNVATVGRIANNLLSGGKGAARYGVYEVKVSLKAAHPEFLINNDFFIANPTAADAYYQYWDGNATLTKQTTIAAVNGLSAQLGLVNGNFDGDPMIDATFHLKTGSPCIDKATSIDLPAQDFDGDSRPKGAKGDVGPDEAQ